MKKGIIYLLFVSLTAVLTAQDGAITLELEPFTELKAFDGISVELIRSNENKAEISGANTQKVAIVNNKGVLKIRMTIDRIFSGYRTFVKLYYTSELKVIDVNEDALISSKEVLKTNVLDVRAQESGELKLTAETTQLLARAVTGGVITVKGSTDNQDIVINTGGQYNGKDLKSEFTTISVNAGGQAAINATNYVKANVKAGGTVKVYGDPKKMDEKTVFGGKIERVE